MGSRDPSQPAGSIDPLILDQLVDRLTELRQSEPNVGIDDVLEDLDPSLRSVYRQPLEDRVRDEQHEANFETLDHTATTDDDSVPDNATIEQPGGFRPPTARIDLPPAPRRKRERPVFGQGTETHPLPETIGNYRIKGELGRGAFGVVYLGYDDELQRNVAIKLALVSDDKLQQRLRVEASKVARIESTGIVPVYHIGKTETGAVYIVQKYIEGASLRSILENEGTLSPARAVQLLREIALGLEPAHAMDILHRDLKPDNVLIDRNGKAWIADFGLAISEAEQVERRRELAGTPPYMSPEQIQGRIDFLDARSDLWSLGVMFYELLSGKRPFQGNSRQSFIDQICELDPRPLQQRAPGLLTEEMNDLFLRCCAKKPADRFASARELVNALDELIAGGLSDQNLEGNVITAEGIPSTREYETAGSRFGSGRGSTRVDTRADSTKLSTERDSQVSLHGSVSGSSSWIATFVSRAAIVIGVIAISVLASYAFQHFSRPIADPDVETRSNIAGDLALSEPEKDLNDDLPESKAIAGDLSNSGVTKRPPSIDADGSIRKPWIVSLDNTGTHGSIQEAMDVSAEGAHIHIQPGIYFESLQIKAAITLVGLGELGECEIEGVDDSPLTIDCDGNVVTVQNLRIDAKGHKTTKEFNAINVNSGTLVINSSQLETGSFNCIKVKQGARVAAIDCSFLDSKEFAISTKDHDAITVQDCVFRVSGIQLVGGSARIERSEFYGHEGVYVERSGETPIRITDCLFDQCSEYGVVATTEAKVEIANSTFRSCNYGVKAGLAVDDQAAKNADLKSGQMSLDGVTFEDCAFALSTDDASELIAKNGCKISGGKWGVAMNSGTIRIMDGQISDTSDGGILCVGEGQVIANNVQIQRAGLYGIKMSSGKLQYEGGVVEACSVMGVSFEGDSQGGSIDSLKLVDNGQAGISISAGPLELTKLTVTGSDVGIFAQAEEEAERLVIRVDQATFHDIGQYAVYARGAVAVALNDCDYGNVPADRRAKRVGGGEIRDTAEIDGESE